MKNQQEQSGTGNAAASSPPAPDKKESDNSKKTLVIVLIVAAGVLFLLFLVVLIGGIVFLKSYKKNLEAKYLQDLTAMENYSPTGDISKENLKETPSSGSSADHAVKQSTNKADRYPYDNAYLSNSTYYWNCKYHYSLSYPKGWTIDDQSHNAMQAFIKGGGVTVKLESIGLVAGETLQQLAQRRNEPGKISSSTAGINVWSETINWDGQDLVETHYVKPDAIILHWLEGGRGMEMMIFGTGFNNNFTNIEKMLATLAIGIAGPPVCGTSSSSSSSSDSGFDCASWVHPNGDIEYWWDQASPEEKDCYVTKYGAPPFYEP